jgi:hypothetical protein
MSAATRSPSCATPCKSENPVAAQKKFAEQFERRFANRSNCASQEKYNFAV